MGKLFKKSLDWCTATLLISCVATASNLSNYSASAHQESRTNRVIKNRRIRKSHQNQISYKNYSYNLKKDRQSQQNLKKAKRNYWNYKKLLQHHRYLTRKYTSKIHYWQKQINALSHNEHQYQRSINRYKSNHPLVDATHKYVLSTRDMVSSHNLHKLENFDTYQYGGGKNGDLVHITAQKQIDGKTFDYIKDPKGYDNDMWIYVGELSKSPSATVHNINLNRVHHDMYVNYSTKNAKTFKQQMKIQSLAFINKARKKYGIHPLKENPIMDQLATLRAEQLTKNYRHYNHKGHSYYLLDAHQLKIATLHGWAENIAYGHINHKGKEPTDPTVYNEMNGNGMAYAANNNMLNHDAHSRWGHRHNMLNPKAYLIGLGSSYVPKTQTYYLTEDFYKNPNIVRIK